MGIVGAEILLRRGYSMGQVMALARIAEQNKRTVTIMSVPGRTYLTWSLPESRAGIPHGAGGFSPHRQAGITGNFKQVPVYGGVWDVYEPGYSKTSLTGNEMAYILPIARPSNEKIAFNPFQEKTPEGAARGYFFYENEPGVKKPIDFRGLTQGQVQASSERLAAGKSIPELWKWGGYYAQSIATPEQLQAANNQRKRKIVTPKGLPGLNPLLFRGRK